MRVEAEADKRGPRGQQPEHCPAPSRPLCCPMGLTRPAAQPCLCPAEAPRLHLLRGWAAGASHGHELRWLAGSPGLGGHRAPPSLSPAGPRFKHRSLPAAPLLLALGAAEPLLHLCTDSSARGHQGPRAALGLRLLEPGPQAGCPPPLQGQAGKVGRGQWSSLQPRLTLGPLGLG